jgi:hypothetical protein
MAGLIETLKRLRRTLTLKAEDAYTERDQATGTRATAYADGEAHAFGIAADEVHDAEEDHE